MRQLDINGISFSVYVPSTTQTVDKIPDFEFKERVRIVASFLNEHCGGSTINGIASGSWLAEDRKLIQEDIVIVTTLTEVKKYNKILRQVKQWVDEFDQICITITAFPLSYLFVHSAHEAKI